MPAATLAQQRAKFKATNAAHRISAPVLSSPSVGDGRPTTWGSQLSQLAEQNGPAQEIAIGSRPKSTEFVGSPRPSNGEVTLPPKRQLGQHGQHTSHSHVPERKSLEHSVARRCEHQAE